MGGKVIELQENLQSIYLLYLIPHFPFTRKWLANNSLFYMLDRDNRSFGNSVIVTQIGYKP